jgi:chitin synthase
VETANTNKMRTPDPFGDENRSPLNPNPQHMNSYNARTPSPGQAYQLEDNPYAQHSHNPYGDRLHMPSADQLASQPTVSGN